MATHRTFACLVFCQSIRYISLAGVCGNRTHLGGFAPDAGFEDQRAHQDSSTPGCFTNKILSDGHWFYNNICGLISIKVGARHPNVLYALGYLKTIQIFC